VAADSQKNRILDYASGTAVRPSRTGFWHGLWSCMGSGLAIGLPACLYYGVHGGHPYQALDLFVSEVCISLPLLVVATGLAIAASFASRKEWITLVAAWLLILIQTGYWVSVLVFLSGPPRGGGSPG
jgi:hypothetical protein